MTAVSLKKILTDANKNNYMFHHDVFQLEVYQCHVCEEESQTNLPAIQYTAHYIVTCQLYHDVLLKEYV